MTKDQIADRVKKLLVEHMNVDPVRVIPSANLIDDLKADSLDLIELVMAAEEEFELEIPDADAEELVNVQDTVNYIASRFGL